MGNSVEGGPSLPWWLAGLCETCASTTWQMGGAEDGRDLVQNCGFTEGETASGRGKSSRERDLVRGYQKYTWAFSCLSLDLVPWHFGQNGCIRVVSRYLNTQHRGHSLDTLCYY